jgi:hypothetical protein
MRHRDAVAYLPDFALDSLDASTRAAVESHVDRCAACKSWLKTHEFLAETLIGSPDREHPDSSLLALCAVRPEEEYELDRSGFNHHLEICGECREDLERVRDAISAARPATARAAHATSPKLISSWWRIAAAAIAGLAIGSLFTFGPWRVGPHDPEPIEIPIQSDESSDVEPSSKPEEVSGIEIEGNRLIEAERALTITKVKIKDGARVTIRAGEVVAFGDGFQIGRGTRVAVGAGSRKELRKDHPS